MSAFETGTGGEREGQCGGEGEDRVRTGSERGGVRVAGAPQGRRREEGVETREDTMRGERIKKNTPRLVIPEGVGGLQKCIRLNLKLWEFQLI